VAEGPSDNSAESSTGDGNAAGGPGHAVVNVVLYAAARLLLAVVLTAAIYGVARLLGIGQFPVIVAALFALIIAMPLGIWVFSPLRRRATSSLAVAGQRRRREREQLQARLHGDAVSDEGRDDA
jgi:hypothetical protein